MRRYVGNRLAHNGILTGILRSVQHFAVVAAIVATALLAGGCASDPPAPKNADRTTLFLPGVFGDGAVYNGLRRAIASNRSVVRTVTWGFPKVAFVANFSDEKIHEQAEAKLAAVIDQTGGDIHLVGHSAGCGVILGALAKAHRPVGTVVLIAPSVSPGYDLTIALNRSKVLHYFSSDRDTTFLKWRCGTFGTYDRVKTPAAGYSGFSAKSPKLVQHPYDPSWEALGNGGGHSDAIGERFAAAVILPLLTR